MTLIYPTMSIASQRLACLDDLRGFVRERLCELNGLAAEAFEMTERQVVRAGRQCGLLFCIQGPRSTRFTAVWDAERNRILFYGSAGERLQEELLAFAPTMR